MLVEEILLRVGALEKKKAEKVKEIIRLSKPRRMIGEDIRNETVLALVDELRELQEQIDDLTAREVVSD